MICAPRSGGTSLESKVSADGSREPDSFSGVVLASGPEAFTSPEGLGSHEGLTSPDAFASAGELMASTQPWLPPKTSRS